MDVSESDTEGQLLIDESAGASKRKTTTRKRAPRSKKVVAKKKKTLKIVVKTAKDKKEKQGTDTKLKDEKVTDTVSPQAVRTSNRVRKRTRRHSPSPVRTKKEPPKKKLKVKITNIKKAKTLAKSKACQTVKKTQDSSGVDIESISDEELNNIQYSSVIIDEEPSVKRQRESKSKGIKLKLSLGKVLSMDESKAEDEQNHDPSSFIPIASESKTEDIETPALQPLIITKRQNSLSSVERYDISTHQNSSTSQSNTGITDTDSTFYSSSSENHKPLMLKLSVERPKTSRQYSVAEIEHKTEKVFPNIRRSWSVASPLQDQTKPVEPETVIMEEPKTQNTEEKTVATPAPQLSTTPYFNAGLQSLLDVVSVELKEHNKNCSDLTGNKLVPPKPTYAQNPLKQPMPLESHFLIRPTSNLPKPPGDALSNHQGHLPSLSFPKPKLNFVSKKRSKAKPAPKSPEYPSMMLSSVFESKGDNTPESELSMELSDKEKRRRDKKKIMNSDFVDPDTLVSGPDPKQKEDPAWKKPTMSSHQQKLGGFSLLMPQMMSKQKDNYDSEPVDRITQKNGAVSIAKRPKKGRATAKQRLASKLKIGRSFAY